MNVSLFVRNHRALGVIVLALIAGGAAQRPSAPAKPAASGAAPTVVVYKSPT